VDEAQDRGVNVREGLNVHVPHNTHLDGDGQDDEENDARQAQAVELGELTDKGGEAREGVHK
jgi:hypothetical protein